MDRYKWVLNNILQLIISNMKKLSWDHLINCNNTAIATKNRVQRRATDIIIYFEIKKMNAIISMFRQERLLIAIDVLYRYVLLSMALRTTWKLILNHQFNQHIKRPCLQTSKD